MIKCYMMEKKSILSISYVGIGTAFNAGLGFLFLTALAKTLSVEEFGKYALLSSLLVAISKILDFGTTSLYVSKSITQEKELKSVLVSTRIILFLISLPISILALVLLNLATAPIFLIFLSGIIFYGLNYTIFAFFQKEQDYLALILINLIPALLKGLFAALLFFRITTLSVEQAFMIFAFSIGLSLILYFFLPAKYKYTKFSLLGVWDFLKQTLSPGTSQIISDSFSAIGNSIAKITTNLTSLGVYSMADKISSVFVFVSFSIFTVLLPKNAQREKDNKKYDFKETAFLATGVFVLATFIVFAARFIVPWFFENKFNDSLPVLNILVFASAIAAINMFMENYFYVVGKTNYLAKIALTRLGFLFIFSALLIPFMAIKGLAMAQLLAALINLLIVIYLIKKPEIISQ